MANLIDLDDLKASKLKSVMHSAEIDPDGASSKDEIIARLNEENVELGADGWTVDGEEFEVTQRSTSRSSDENILYGFLHSGATDERMDEIESLFEDTQYEIRLGKTDGTDKETFKLVIPAEESDENDG